jgi:tetratricopeptide (TPR) repeat protein
MWPRAFLDDPGGSNEEEDGMADYGSGNAKSKRTGHAGILVNFFELSRDGAKLRQEWRNRKLGIFPAPSRDPNAPIVVLEELGSIMNRAVTAYKEALRLYVEEVDKEAQNPSFVCGAQQNVGVTLMENDRCLEAKKYLLEAEITSETNDLQHSQNHCALCENICTVYSKLKDWTNAEIYAGKAVSFDPDQGSLSQKGVGVSKLLNRQARHAYMLMMSGHWKSSVEVSTIVINQSRSHNTIKRRSKMMMVRSVSTIEMAMHERNSEMLDKGEGELIQCIAVTRRAFGQHSMEVADLLEMAAMFMGGMFENVFSTFFYTFFSRHVLILRALSFCYSVILLFCYSVILLFCYVTTGVREDYGQAERYALQAVKSREHGLLEQLEEEKEQQRILAGGKKKDEKAIVQHGELPYTSDPRLQTIMEDSVGFLKNIHMKKFLTPWRFLVWKGT